MNKGVIIGIPIAILIVIAGVYVMSSEQKIVDEPIIDSVQNSDSSEPKRYNESLSESVRISGG